jgi:hypothetical protein
MFARRYAIRHSRTVLEWYWIVLQLIPTTALYLKLFG